MTSRYLRLRAEQVTMTPVEVGVDEVVESLERASSRSRMSQSHLSASVRGMLLPIFSTLAGGWYCRGVSVLVGCLLCSCFPYTFTNYPLLLGRIELTTSPSRYGSPLISCKYSATLVFPHPAGPVMTQMCLWAGCATFLLDVGEPTLEIVSSLDSWAGSEGGVSGMLLGIGSVSAPRFLVEGSAVGGFIVVEAI